jgi:hypothetical protein
MKTWEEHDSNDLSSQECKLLSGAFATFLQVVLGLIALFVLFLKRYYEVPQRPLQVCISFTTFLYDDEKEKEGTHLLI